MGREITVNSLIAGVTSIANAADSAVVKVASASEPRANIEYSGLARDLQVAADAVKEAAATSDKLTYADLGYFVNSLKGNL